MDQAKFSKLPGSAAPDWTLYTESKAELGKRAGIKTPEGKFYPFDSGEKLEWVNYRGAERLGLITNNDGSRILLENWIKQQDNTVSTTSEAFGDQVRNKLGQ